MSQLRHLGSFTEFLRSFDGSLRLTTESVFDALREQKRFQEPPNIWYRITLSFQKEACLSY